ncbi:MAG: nucleotidyl transferase AbiEii/AbiGii toxin family protein [Candidatus Micrarchaeota archaeon]|nr:nucleotidyl transferase AbiEii/AbiGii toxin family protein [Candidatus Micrarchaeota archaeon]
MLNRTELDKYGPPGFNLGQKEKDYVQHWVLSYVSQAGFEGVFKGGTCLQKAFNLPRYSEDLDFTLNDAGELDLEALAAFLSAAGFSGIGFKKEENEVSKSVKMRFRGPLYSGKLMSEGTISLDFSKREKTLITPNPTMINSPYPDILPYQVKVMDKKEIVAEKIRAVMTRRSARDLFDLYFLLRQKIELDKIMIQKKLDYYGVKFEYNKFEDKIKELGKIWKKEISTLTVNIIDYEVVATQVLENVRNI